MNTKNEYQRKWRASRRESFFKGKTCVRCGSSDKLELDHIDPIEKVSHRIWSWSWKRILEEVAKCQILCGFHHQEKTSQERSLANKTHCKLGHLLSDVGLRVLADGSLRCRYCDHVYNMNYKGRTPKSLSDFIANRR